MARRRGTPAATASRYRLGDFWLEPRPEREEWCIAWYDGAARTRRRRSTGIRYSGEDDPPIAAQQALAEHFANTAQPTEPQVATAARCSDLIAHWLQHHVAGLRDPVRYANSAQHLLRFFEHERRGGRVTSTVMVSDINKAFVARFIAFRKAEGASGHTISRDLAALRGSLIFCWKEELIEAAPFVPDVPAADKAAAHDLVYTYEQIAAHMEAAYRREDRRHILLYDIIALSTLGRGEAIIELNADRQIKNGLINFLDADRPQTRKRRSIVPIAPTLAPWLEGVKGKVIRYRAPLSPKKWADPEVPEHFERDCWDIKNGFEACLIDAGICDPILGDDGEQLLLPPRGNPKSKNLQPAWQGRGSPNTLRHTIITEMHRRGIPEGQIDTAAGHAPIGTNKRNYRHLRPDYLAELIAGIEDFWREIDHYTDVHRRTQCGPKVVSMAAARAGRRIENVGKSE